MIHPITYHVLVSIFTIYVLVNSCSYGIHEIKNEKNKSGGIAVISFTIFSVIFSNIMVWLN